MTATLRLVVIVLALVLSAEVAHAEPIEPDVQAWADWIGIDAEKLQGAVNTTGLSPEDYLVAVGHVTLQGPARWTAADTLAAIERVDPALRAWIRRVVACETGHTWNPYSVGDRGASIGAAQLHVNGLRRTFYAWGYSDPWNPFEAISFMEAAFRAGLARHWSCS